MAVFNTGDWLPGWEARTRSLAGPLSPRGPQPVVSLYGGQEKQPMGRRSQSTGYRGFSTRGQWLVDGRPLVTLLFSVTWNG